MANDAAPTGGPESNHRTCRRGYHTAWAACMLLAGMQTCGERRPIPVAPAAEPVGLQWAAERAWLAGAINEARAEEGLPPLVYRSLLEGVGDEHCRALIADGTVGHFATDGVPPYLRYLLAGGVGFHRENVGSVSSNVRIQPTEVAHHVQESLARMLAEEPPHDGHRRTLLDPDANAVGIGLAVEGGEMRVAHEIAVEGCRFAVPPPHLAPPSTTVRLEGNLHLPWRVAFIEVLWEPLPQAMSPAEARARGAYRYPPGRAVFGDGGVGGPAWRGPRALRPGPGDGFSFSWFTGPAEGVEIVVVWARRRASDEPAAVAAFATIVSSSALLPPALERWRSLSLVQPPATCPPSGRLIGSRQP